MDASNINQSIDQKYSEKWSGILARQLQQEHSVLSPWVTHMPACVGNAVNIDYRSGSKIRRIRSAFQDVENPIRDTYGTRQMKPVALYTAHEFTCDSKLYSTQVKEHVPGIIAEIKAESQRTKDANILGIGLDSQNIWRKLTVSTAANSPYDEEIAGGMLGTNYLGKHGTVLKDLPDSQIIPPDFVESGSKVTCNMTLGKIREGLKRLKASHAYIPGVTTPVMAMSSSQIMALMQYFEVSDPMWKVLDMQSGKLSSILGVQLVELEMLPYLAGTTDVRCCPMWIKEHVYFGAWNDVSVRVEGPAEKRVNYGQVVAQMSFGATRKYESSVIEIQCAE